jgi:hypothetical protein
MFRRLLTRSPWAHVLRAFGPPPPPPRRHFSKLWTTDARHPQVGHVTRVRSVSLVDRRPANQSRPER